jgi:four helix bundle protein
MKLPPFDIQKRTFQFSVSVVRFCRTLGGAHPVTRRLSWQLVDAATSMGANMEEADGAQSRADFVNKTAVARKESQEALFWIRLLYVTDPAVRDELRPLLDEARQLAKIISTIKKNAEANLKKRKDDKTRPSK